MSKIAITATLIAALAASANAVGQTAPTMPSPSAPVAVSTAPNDYANAADWLCLPGVHGACDVDLTTTMIAPDGTTQVEKFVRADNPQVDCFYVYPTVSREPRAISDMAAGPEEVSVVAQQFARLGAVCRTFAPLYRQFTLTALAARMRGKPMPMNGIDPKIGYNDVVDAWNYYLKHDNNGRPFVLVGHSQGSGVLIQLIKNEIDGKPIEKRMLSAILMGSRLQVPEGKDVGGDFQATPLCHSAAQLGCAIAYASFRATVPPPPDTFFGRGNAPGLEAACVNPAALGGGSGEAKSYFGRNGSFNGIGLATDWLKGKTIETPFVATPGLITAECAKNDVGTYLAITFHGDPASPRTSDVRGDVIIAGKVQPNWGLHLIDANLFMGNLLDIVRSEEGAYAKH